MRSTSGQAMVWDHVSLCLIIMIVVVNASVSMLVGAVRNDHKHARRELMQNIPGFISIDCGLPVGSPDYIYQETGIVYVRDEGFTQTGESNNITSKVDETIEPYLKNVRSFPEGKRNCYSLKPKAGRNNTYLVRATFLYGNYDSRNSPPEFDLHLGTDMWVSVISTNYTDGVRKEIIYIPTTDYIDVCLVNTNKGVPFISALELRLLNNDIYKTQFGSALQTSERSDFGVTPTQQPIRYKDDVYDRIWFPVQTPDLVTVETKLTTDAMSNNDYKPPPVVMRTAVRSASNNGSLVLNLKPPDTTSGYYVYMHFFEVDSTVQVPRQFTIDLNNMPWLKAVKLPLEKPLTVFATAALKGLELKLTISPTNVSTFPPLLNAMEIYIEKHLQQLHTQLEDVDAMKSIKTSYKIISNWQGDPCLTEDYLWDGLNCNYDQNPSIIISLNLTQRELTGEVDHSISNLKSLESLDLSYNNLSGEIPAFLADMPSLKVLNLAGNNFTGSVPQALLSKNGSTLTLSVGENPYLCVSHCGTKKSSKNKYIVPASIISVLVLVVLVGAFIFWKCRRIGSQEMAIEITKEVVLSAVESTKIPLLSKTRSFTYSEISSITNKFDTPLGKGASGEVYRGYLKDQGEVAVKRLTESSTESASLFQTEVELLWRIHHNRLVSFLGYCDDGTNMAVVYEFMASGSLKKNLSEENPKILTWKERLQIAVDAAQGLEYLHKHCIPSIVHRDLKPDNILLDKNLRAKISDFGISIVFEAGSRSHISTEKIAGTIGYLDPEYHSIGKLSEKSDVYSFGIVLLELITGRPVVIKDTEGTQEFIHIVKWIEPLLKEKRDINDIIDSRLQGNFGMDSALKVIKIAMECVPETAKPRPDMATVLAKLKECLALESRDVGASRVDADDKGTSRLIKKASMEM